MVSNTDLLGRYRILSRLGSGSSGAVFEVEDRLSPGRIIAAKVLNRVASPDRVERLKTEFSALSMLRHPHLIRAYDLHVVPSLYPFLMTMERVYGREFLAFSAGLPVPALLRLLADACSALGFLHERGLAHRDIKSENLLVDERRSSPRVVLTDLGLAGTDGLLLAAEAGGTLHYLPP
jgi:eukaryotic-like serine/threonine-protein kinase